MVWGATARVLGGLGRLARPRRRRARGPVHLERLALDLVLGAAPWRALALGELALALRDRRPARPARSARRSPSTMPGSASVGPANSTTIARIWVPSVHAAVHDAGGHSTASPAATRACSSPTPHEAAALDHDEPGRVGVAVRRRSAPRAPERELRDHPARRRLDDLALRCRSSRPARPAGGGRPRTGDLHQQRPARRGVSGGGAGATPCARIVRLGWANFVAREVALLRELPLVRREDRREADEPDPDDHAEADQDRGRARR